MDGKDLAQEIRVFLSRSGWDSRTTGEILGEAKDLLSRAADVLDESP